MSINASFQVCPQRIFAFDAPDECLQALICFARNLIDRQLIGDRGSSDSGSFYLLGSSEAILPEFTQLSHWLQECIGTARDLIVWDKCNFPGLKVTQVWINVSRTFDSHPMHVHPLSILSGVMCLSDQVELDIFVPSIYSLPSILCVDTGEQDLLVKQTIGLSKGDMIVFPSTLRHAVSAHQGVDTRLTLAFNSFFAGSLGGDSDLASLWIDPKVC